MALQKSKEAPDGASGNYWRIDQLSFSKKRSRVDCRMSQYKDEASKDSKAPMSSKRYQWNGAAADALISDNDDPNKDTITKGYYKKIKAEDSDLEGATDV